MKDVIRGVVCAICLEVSTRLMTLPCGHVFCEECVAKLCTTNGRLIKCPECRMVHMVLSGGFRFPLPAQHIYENAADGLKNTAFQKRPVPAPRSCSVLPRPKPRPRILPKPSTVIPNNPDPLLSFVEKMNFTRTQVGKEFAIVVQLRDKNRQVIARKSEEGNITAFVDLKPRPRDFQTEEIQASLTREGKYLIKYQAKRCGMHVISILLQNKIIQGSPVTVRVKPRGHPGCEIKGPLKFPVDVTEYHGNFLVTDIARKAVLFIDQAGREIKELKVQENIKENFFPVAITTFKNRVFVTDLKNSSAHVYQNLDVFPRHFGGNHLKSPSGIAVSSRNGDIFIVDNILRQVLAFNRNLQFLKVLCFQTSPTGSGRMGNEEILQNPHMMTINSNGNKLFIVDRGEIGNDSIKVINVAGNTLERTIKVRLLQSQARPFGITLDQDDNIFVSVQINTEKISSGEIAVFNSDGNYLGSIKSFKLQPIVSVSGLFVSTSPAGMPPIVYVVDANPVEQKKGSLKGFII